MASDDQVDVGGLFGIPRVKPQLHSKKWLVPVTQKRPSEAAFGWQAMLRHPTSHVAGSVSLELLSRWAALCLSGLLDVEGLDLVDVFRRVEGDSGTVHGLCHLTSTNLLFVAVVDTAKLEAMQEDIESLSRASWFTMMLSCVFFAAHALSCSEDVIHVDAEDTVHHIVVTLVLEDLKKRVTIQGQAD